MADVVAIRAALAVCLDTITGLRVDAYCPASINTPGGFIDDVTEIDFDQSMGRGCDRMVFPVVIMVAKATDKSASQKLDSYLAGSGAKSVKAVLESNNTLGGIVSSTHVLRVRDVGAYERGGSPSFHGATFDVEIYT